MSKRTIGWQKYEDVLENQLSSPLVRIMLEQTIQAINDSEQQEFIAPPESEGAETHVIGMSEDIAQDAALASNFDCWVGHTNFNITEEIKTALNTVDGVEVLKICSRYRFFVGIGKMFNLRSDMFDISQNQYSYEYYHYIYNNGITIISKNNTETFDLTHLDFRKYYTNSRNNYIWDGIIIQNNPYPKEYCDRFDYTIIKEKANKKKNNSPNTKLHLPIKFET